jgi:uncharacterized membrane protein YhaH (DUF805 family)
VVRFVSSRYQFFSLHPSPYLHLDYSSFPRTLLLIQLQIHTISMASPSRPSNGRRPDRTLRIITIVAFVPALALLIPSGVVTARPLPAIGLVPMAMSLVISMAALGSKKSPSKMRPMADSIVAVSLMIVMVFRSVHPLSWRKKRKDGVLLPARETDLYSYHSSWITLAENYWLSAGSAMLCAYGIVPMMVNLYVTTQTVNLPCSFPFPTKTEKQC